MPDCTENTLCIKALYSGMEISMEEKKTKKYDPVELEIMWNRFISILEEQAQTLIRTAFSSILADNEDLSAGLFDTKGRMIAQAKTGVAGHINSMAIGTKHFLEHNPPETLKDGDVLIGNNAYEISGHVLDITAVTPVFFKGKIVAYVASTCHVYDLGGVGYSADGRSIYEEGLYIPYLKYYKEGVRDEAICKIIAANSRQPHSVIGDIEAQITAQKVAIKGLLKMFDEFGIDEIDTIGEEILNISEKAMRNAISAMPDGEYEYELNTDGIIEGEHIVYKTQVKIEGDEIWIDFQGTSPAIPDRGFNSCLNYTQAYGTYGAKAVIAKDVPNNEGTFRPIHITAPEGSIINAPHPYPMQLRHITGFFVPATIIGALSVISPETVPAESCATNYCVQAYFNNNKDYAISMVAGGMGGRPGKDGLSATHFPTNTSTTQVEVLEMQAPFLVKRKELLTDTGGYGEYRGGLGQIFEFGTISDSPWILPASYDRIIYPAKGYNGAGDGAKAKFYRNGSENLPGKIRIQLEPTDVITIETAGGAGFGNPKKRAPERVLSDVINGYVSQEAALRDYGICVEQNAEGDFYINTEKSLR